jgi:hypothetical protein
MADTEQAANAPALMAHQVEGVNFLLERRSGILAFEQGLGKTLVAIQDFVRLRAARAADLLLALCPNSLKRNWTAELARFVPELDAVIIEGSPRVRRRALSDTRAAAVIVRGPEWSCRSSRARKSSFTVGDRQDRMEMIYVRRAGRAARSPEVAPVEGDHGRAGASALGGH